jgi:hypothetical protein
MQFLTWHSPWKQFNEPQHCAELAHASPRALHFTPPHVLTSPTSVRHCSEPQQSASSTHSMPLLLQHAIDPSALGPHSVKPTDQLQQSTSRTQLLAGPTQKPSRSKQARASPQLASRQPALSKLAKPSARSVSVARFIRPSRISQLGMLGSFSPKQALSCSHSV